MGVFLLLFKKIVWEFPIDSMKYPESGKFWENILAMDDNTTLKSGQAYSATVTMPTDMVIWLDMYFLVVNGAGTLETNKSISEKLGG
jgi:hypothetical protein